MINIRTLIFTSLIFLTSILVLSFNTISFNFLGIDIDRGDSESILGLSLGLDLKGGTHLVYEAVPNKDREITSEDMEGARKILERRVNSFGISESSVQIVGSGSGVSKKLLVQLPGLSDLNINMTRIETRPSRNNDYLHTFFIDFEGYYEDSNIIKLLEILENMSEELRIIGSYTVLN